MHTWFQTIVYSLLVVCGQSAATLLGRLYYMGGNSPYMAALVQSAAFPCLLLPLLYIAQWKKFSFTCDASEEAGLLKNLALPALYIGFGIFLAFDCMMYAIGLMYLPLTTYSLLCATQIGFNACFSYFLNSHNLTPCTINSIVLLLISTVLLALQPKSSNAGIRGKFAVGFVCTMIATIVHALILSLKQLAYGRVLKRRQTIVNILKAIFFESMVTSCVLVIGLFGSGEWRNLREEMEGFKPGRKWYVVTLVCAALAWQAFGVGIVSLSLKVSSLFGNVMSTLTVPIIPVLGVLVFQEKMNGLKIVALVLAIWGCMSYVYQQYLFVLESKARNPDTQQETETRVE